MINEIPSLIAVNRIDKKERRIVKDRQFDLNIPARFSFIGGPGDTAS